jgi:hypothetical protein
MPLTRTQAQLRNQLELVILKALRPRLEDFITHTLTEKLVTEGSDHMAKYRYEDGNVFAVLHNTLLESGATLDISVRERESLLMSVSYRLREASEALHFKKE